MPIGPEGEIPRPLVHAGDALSRGLSTEKHQRLDQAEAKKVASLFGLFLRCLPGGDLAREAAETLLARLFGNIPQGVVEFAAITLIYLSPAWLFLLWRFGIIESFWSGALGLLSRIF
jgi:hypothetical protein